MLRHWNCFFFSGVKARLCVSQGWGRGTPGGWRCRKIKCGRWQYLRMWINRRPKSTCCYCVSDASPQQRSRDAALYHFSFTRFSGIWRLRGCATPQTFSRDCSGAVCDGELTLNRTDTPFKPDITSFLIFRSDLVTDLLRHKWTPARSQNVATLQLPMTGKIYQKDETFQR